MSSDADGNEGYARQGAQQQRLRSHSPASKGKPVHRGQGSKGRAGEGSQDGLRRMVVTKRKAEPQLSGGPGGEEEVVSPRPGHAAALAWNHDGHEHPTASRQKPTAGHSQQRQQSQHQQQRRQQRQPVADEHHSEGEHYWSTHSPNVAESPVVFVDQNSSRSSQDHGAAAHNSQVSQLPLPAACAAACRLLPLAVSSRLALCVHVCWQIICGKCRHQASLDLVYHCAAVIRFMTQTMTRCASGLKCILRSSRPQVSLTAVAAAAQHTWKSAQT